MFAPKQLLFRAGADLGKGYQLSTSVVKEDQI